MALRFTVLASGSAGNASLVEAGDFGVLLDAGLGPRQLGSRLAAIGKSWSDIDAALLTHTHGDHWRETTLSHLLRRRLPLYCHADHQQPLLHGSTSFGALHQAGLVREYLAHEMLPLSSGLRCRPLPISHDDSATFGFRFEGQPDLFGHATALAYVADLGCWDDELAGHLADVDLLAVEFNHDPELEMASGRSAFLIARVLGDRGHLSNGQAADLVRAIMARSRSGRLRFLVQLHLSRQCNRPQLALHAALSVVPGNVAVHTAQQNAPCRTIHLGPDVPARARQGRLVRRRLPRPPALSQPWLPGIEWTTNADLRMAPA